MIHDSFFINVDFYKRGMYEEISYYSSAANQVITLHSKQVAALKLFNDNVTTYIGYGGSARGGKSELLSLVALLECFVYPEGRYLIGRYDLQILWATTWKTLKRIMTDFGFLQNVDYHWHSTKKEMTFKNGSQIIAMNLQDLPKDPDQTRFGSLELTKAFIDQSEHVSEVIVNKIGERVGSHMAVRHKIKGKVLEAFNPSRSHVFRRYWIPFKNGVESERRKFIRALPSDNPGSEAKQWLGEKIADYSAGVMTEGAYQRQILGNFDWDDDDDALCEYGNILNVFSNVHVQPGSDRYATLDIAAQGSDKFLMFIWYGFVVVEIIELAKSDYIDIMAAYNAAKQKHGFLNSMVVFDSDGVGGLLSGKPIAGAVSFVNGGRALNGENYATIKDQLGYKLATVINENNIFVGANVTAKQKEEIIEELSYLKSKDKNREGKLRLIPKKEIRAALGRSPDYLDNFIMRMYFAVVKQKARRRSYGRK